MSEGAGQRERERERKRERERELLSEERSDPSEFPTLASRTSMRCDPTAGPPPR